MSGIDSGAGAWAKNSGQRTVGKEKHCGKNGKGSDSRANNVGRGKRKMKIKAKEAEGH